MELKSGPGAGDLDLAAWMAAFEHVPVPNLLLPGSHDSGAQDLDFCRTGPDWKQARGILPLGCCVIVPWSQAQGLGPGDLLHEGCRYFDLRIGIGDAGEYILCHGFASRHTLGEFLREVREFLDEHPSEAVVLEVKHVHSFDDEVSMEDHEALIAYLEGELGGKEVFVDETQRMRPLGELLGQRRQVFAVYRPGGYGHDAAPVDRHRDTMMPFSCLRSSWPNECDPGEVCSFLEKEMEEQAEPSHGNFLVLQGVLTAGAAEIVKGALCGLVFDRSLRNLAHRLEPELETTLRDMPLDQLAHGAIVMVDWLHEQPALVEWTVRTNYACHPA